jgi:hypothetical protein
MSNKHNVFSRQHSSVQTSLTPLYEACRDGNEEQVREILPKYSHADLNRQQFPYGGNTCLHVAAAKGHDNIVKLLLNQGCYRSLFLNCQNQSAYDIAASNKESTRLLFLRQDENDPSLKSSSRFYEPNASGWFDIVKVDDNEEDNEKLIKFKRRPTINTEYSRFDPNSIDSFLNLETHPRCSSMNEGNPERIGSRSIQTYKTQEEKNHEIEYSVNSKTICQSRFYRFCINHLNSDEPLDHQTIIKRLNNLLEQNHINNSNDYIKADDLMKQYQKNSNSIEQLLHLYTLETQFYRALKQDCLTLAIPLFMNLSKLKKRFFKGRVYRGTHMTYAQLLTYQIAMETPGALLQTNSFSSTSIDRYIAEQFLYIKPKTNEKDLCVLFTFDFPDICDQAINLSRLSIDTPSLSEYEDEKEVLILPGTLFEVTRVRKATDEDDLYTIYLTNTMIPKKPLLSTFKWTWVEFKNQLTKDKKH